MPWVSGLPAFGSERMQSFLPASSASHTHPEPKRVVAFWVNSCLNASTDPKSFASLSATEAGMS